MYLRDIYINKWEEIEAETQFQGRGMSHELASLLLTETIQFSLKINKKPIFILSLDALSAFDKIIHAIFVKELFFTQVNEKAVLYIDNKLRNRIS